MKATFRIATLVVLCLLCHSAMSQSCERTSDVIYGRKLGMSLTMDVLQPPEQNGAAVVWIASGGFYSRGAMIAGDSFAQRMEPFLSRGYTVFAVLHGSAPKFEMREITADCHRAVRYIRHHAGDFGVDSNRIGVSGSSAGASLALLLGTKGGPGNPQAADPVERESSRVQAVACFFPGTDWLNFTADGVDCLAITRQRGLIDGFSFHDYDPDQKQHILVTDPEHVTKILRDYSAVYWATPESAPALMIHGEKDVMPPYHSTRMADALKAKGVPAEVIIKKGEGHGWANMEPDMQSLADWYDRHLEPLK